MAMTLNDFKNKVQDKKNVNPKYFGNVSKPLNVGLSNSPWSPARILNIPENLKDNNYVYRWCNTEKLGNIQKKRSEGWEIDTELSGKLNALYNIPKTLDDGSSLDTTVRMRELVVMRMRKEVKEKRDAYYRSLSNTNSVRNDSFYSKHPYTGKEMNETYIER